MMPLMSLDAPPTLYSLDTSVWIVASLCGLLYVAPGIWLCWRYSRHQEPERQWISALVGTLGASFCFVVVASAGHFLAWLNSRDSLAVSARSTLVYSYSESYRQARGGTGYFPHMLILDRLQPSVTYDVPASLTRNGTVSHLCVQEHVGRYGWLWYDDFRDCNEALEHLAMRDMTREWLSDTELAEVILAPTYFATPLELDDSPHYTAVEQPPGSGQLVRVVVPKVHDPIWAGVDINAWTEGLPILDEVKAQMFALALSADRQRMLVRSENWLFLLDHGRNEWTWLRTDLSQDLFAFSRSRWAFGSDMDTLLEYIPERNEARRWTISARQTAEHR